MGILPMPTARMAVPRRALPMPTARMAVPRQTLRLGGTANW